MGNGATSGAATWQWLLTNWFWILIVIAFIALHLFGHGGHGNHGGHGDKDGTRDEAPTRGRATLDSDAPPDRSDNVNQSGHHH